MHIEPTYQLKRKCQHCGKPIADHEHASRKHCPRIVLDDGRIVNCKDRFHSKKNKPINDPFKAMARQQKNYHKQIGLLLQKEGTKVTPEQVNRYGINLSRPFEFRITQDRRFVFYYHEFAIEQLAQNQYKIFKHGLF